MAIDLAVARERCIRPSAQIARKSAKYLSSLEKTVLYIARIVFLSTRIATVK